MSEHRKLYNEWFDKQLNNKFGHFVWNETEVDALMVDHETHEEVIIQQVLDYFRTIDVPMLKEGNIRTMFQLHNYTDFHNAAELMSNYDKEHWFSCIGANGTKIWEGMCNVYKGIPLWKLMGATPFFGRGVGTRKFKKLLKGLQVKSTGELTLLNKAQIISVESFEDKTASKIVAGMEDFIHFMNGIYNVQVEVEVQGADGELQGKKFCFTGFRDKEMQTQVEAEGGTMQSNVSGKTTILVAKNPNSNSGKMKKAREKGVRVMGIEEFRDFLT